MSKNDYSKISVDSKYLSLEKYKNIKNGTVVKHEVFGYGTVCQINKFQIEILFEGSNSQIGLKKFMFPNAFVDGYLKI